MKIDVFSTLDGKKGSEMRSDKDLYQGRFPQSIWLQELASNHYEKSYASKYWGSNGAIRIAHSMAKEMDQFGISSQTTLLLLSTYFSAANTAFALWGKQKWKFWMMLRALHHLGRARFYADVVLDDYPKYHFGSTATLMYRTLSDLEVLMSPYCAIAVKGKRFPSLVEKEKETALWIGRYALHEHIALDGTLTYALLAGKVALLLDPCTEKENLLFLVRSASENKQFSRKDRVRLYLLLGEYDKAEELAKEDALPDVVLKAEVR